MPRLPAGRLRHWRAPRGHPPERTGGPGRFNTHRGWLCGGGRKELKGANHVLDFPSVGATENLLMAATRAGVTRLTNVAREPGSRISRTSSTPWARRSGVGTDAITVVGVDALRGAEHVVMPDRIEAGTFLAAGVATGGVLTVANAGSPAQLPQEAAGGRRRCRNARQQRYAPPHRTGSTPSISPRCPIPASRPISRRR